MKHILILKKNHCLKTVNKEGVILYENIFPVDMCDACVQQN